MSRPQSSGGRSFTGDSEPCDLVSILDWQPRRVFLDRMIELPAPQSAYVLASVSPCDRLSAHARAAG